jgi:hypothetical protein
VSWLDDNASEDEGKVRIKKTSRKQGRRPVLDLDGNPEVCLLSLLKALLTVTPLAA